MLIFPEKSRVNKYICCDKALWVMHLSSHIAPVTSSCIDLAVCLKAFMLTLWTWECCLLHPDLHLIWFLFVYMLNGESSFLNFFPHGDYLLHLTYHAGVEFVLPKLGEHLEEHIHTRELNCIVNSVLWVISDRPFWRMSLSSCPRNVWSERISLAPMVRTLL